MSDYQVCKLKYRNGSKSFRLNIRYFPSNSKHPEEITASFAKMIRSAFAASLADELESTSEIQA